MILTPLDGTPAWAYDEDGYCVCCGNGHWKHHMPECELRDALDAVGRVANLDIEGATKALRRFVEAFEGEGAKPYESAIEVVLVALGITEDTTKEPQDEGETQ